MTREYVETGGLRWGASHWKAWNASWPFARLLVSPERLEITVGVWRFCRKFEFSRSEIRALRRKRGMSTTGVRVEHAKSGYPPYILFWTFNFASLRRQLEERGYIFAEEDG